MLSLIGLGSVSDYVAHRCKCTTLVVSRTAFAVWSLSAYWHLSSALLLHNTWLFLVPYEYVAD